MYFESHSGRNMLNLANIDERLGFEVTNGKDVSTNLTSDGRSISVANKSTLDVK